MVNPRMEGMVDLKVPSSCCKGADVKEGYFNSDNDDNYDAILMETMTTIECPRLDKLCCERVNSGGGDLARGLLSHGQVHHHQNYHRLPQVEQ